MIENTVRELDYSIDIALDNEHVTASATPRTPFPQDAEFAFYLMHGKAILQRTRYSPRPFVEFELVEPGSYSVKAFVRSSHAKQSRQSGRVTLRKAHDVPEEAPPPSLPYAKLSAPHQDIAAVLAGEEHQTTFGAQLENVATETGLQLSKAPSPGSFVLHGEPLSGSITTVAFSGTGRTTGQLVFGQPDLASISPESVHESIGEFTLFAFNGDAVEVRTDYFGVGKVYYFSGNGVVALANRMHLLLEVLVGIGIYISPDRAKIRAGLQAVNQMFTQNFAAAMDVEGCRCLPAGNLLRATSAGIELLPSEIMETFSQSTAQLPGSERYRALVEQGADEIVDNLRLALEHPEFERVRIDFTGGLDARMLAAAISRIPGHTDRVEINTTHTEASPLDLPISLRLTRELGLDYDSAARKVSEMDSRSSLLELLSVNLGGYFGLNAETSRTKLPRTLRINGFFGEICARPYFARLVFGMGYAKSDPGDFAAAYLRTIPQRARPLSSQSDLESQFRTEFEELPGRSSVAKFEAYYLFHRNGLHCSDRWASRTTAPSWGPLQSKSLFALKWTTLDTYKDIRVQMDATEYLNEKLALLPVGREKDNLERAKISAKYPLKSRGLVTELEVTDGDHARYAEALRQRREKTVRTPAANSLDSRENNSSRFERMLSWTLLGIRELSDTHRIFSSSEAEELQAFVEQEYGAESRQMSHAGTITTNKILSALYQCRLTQRTAGPRLLTAEPGLDGV